MSTYVRPHVLPRQKVAEGEYELFEGTEGTLEWTLWKTPEGYVVGVNFSDKDEYRPSLLAGEIHLDQDMRVVRYELFPLPGTGELYPERVGCELRPEELYCWDDTAEKSLSIDPPYELAPVFPWFAVSAIRRVDSGPDKKAAMITVVILDDDDPFDFFVTEAEVT